MATPVPSQAEALEAWRDRLMAGQLYQKVTPMHARLAVEDGVLETVINGKVETTKTYKAGDYILLGTEGEKYVLGADKFGERYDLATVEDAGDADLSSQGYKVYRPTGRVWAAQLDADAVQAAFPAGKFIAAWGSEMVVEAGDYIATPYPAAGEIYRVEKSAFANTYKPVEP
uniref:Uncharacterized protein n=1 Tax=Alexandrium monilatum TaxID=311494 RepID=A0A6T1GLY1_9DINO